MAVINPFPEEDVRHFLAGADGRNRYLFALCNAQRAVTMADDAVGGLADPDRGLVDATLDACWAAADGTSGDRLRDFIEPLYSEIVPDDDDEYSSYNSAVNSALSALVYAIESFSGDDPVDSAYYAASSMFDLADYLLHRNREGDYVNDLAAAPITSSAALSVVSDMERLSGDIDLRDLRQRVTDEGYRIASLAS